MVVKALIRWLLRLFLLGCLHHQWLQLNPIFAVGRIKVLNSRLQLLIVHFKSVHVLLYILFIVLGRFLMVYVFQAVVLHRAGGWQAQLGRTAEVVVSAFAAGMRAFGHHVRGYMLLVLDCVGAALFYPL